MIVVRLIGGLGNQMFQYAAGRAIADQLNSELLLDTRAFENYNLYSYGLDRFKIRARLATNQELKEWPEWQRKIARLANRLGLSSRWLLESSYQYDLSFNFLHQSLHARNVYLDGYFQSYKYFNNIANNLYSDFHIKSGFSKKNSEILDAIIASQSVALHVRRGDYETNKSALKFHGLCSIEYYKTAISYIHERVDKPTFFVFSNDSVWAKNNLSLGSEAIYIEDNQSEPELDIFLMYKCGHHIIANSTFSWWGAWLSQNVEKICIAPTPWFNKTGMMEDDLIPSSWVRIAK